MSVRNLSMGQMELFSLLQGIIIDIKKNYKG